MYKRLLIWRYFTHKRVSIIAVLAVMLLVMTVVVVLSIMSGLLEEIRDRNHHWSGDIIITRDSLVGFAYYEELMARIGQLDTVELATPVIRTFGLVNNNQSTQIYGLRLEEFCRVTKFADTLKVAQDVPSFQVPYYENRPDSAELARRGCIVGVMDNLAHDYSGLRTNSGLSWDLTVFALNSKGAVTGSDIGQSQRFWFVNASTTNLVDIDAAVFYVDFELLQHLCLMDGFDGRPPRINEIRIGLKPHANSVRALVEIHTLLKQFVGDYHEQVSGNLLEDLRAATWKEFRRAMIAPVEKERSLMTLVFGMIGILAVFIIFAIFYMIVTEKIRDLGIIKSVGAGNGAVAGIFLGFGALVGLIGASIGALLGSLLVIYSNQIEDVLYLWFKFRLWPPDLYAIAKIPDQIEPVFVLGIVAAAVAASVAGAVFPALRAARLNIVDTLRVE